MAAQLNLRHKKFFIFFLEVPGSKGSGFLFLKLLCGCKEEKLSPITPRQQNRSPTTPRQFSSGNRTFRLLKLAILHSFNYSSIMKQIVTYQLSIKVAGTFRVSPEYATPEEACSKIVPFIKRLRQHYTQVTIIQNVRTVAQP